jgi:hypothetical protein
MAKAGFACQGGDEENGINTKEPSKPKITHLPHVHRKRRRRQVKHAHVSVQIEGSLHL